MTDKKESGGTNPLKRLVGRWHIWRVRRTHLAMARHMDKVCLGGVVDRYHSNREWEMMLGVIYALVARLPEQRAVFSWRSLWHRIPSPIVVFDETHPLNFTVSLQECPEEAERGNVLLIRRPYRG